MKQMKQTYIYLLLVLLCNSVFAQLPANVPTNGLVAFYPFNANANDESGNANNGTVNGATLTTDRFENPNSAYYFSSTGCATRIDANVNTSSIQTGLTISLWVLREGNGCIGPRLFEFWPGADGPGQAQWRWDNNTQNIGMGSTTASGFICNSSVPISANNVWSHIVYTNDGANGKFYKDGVLINTLASTGNPILAGNLAIGRMNHPSWDAFNGKIDDFGVWNRALTTPEIETLFNDCPEITITASATEVCAGDNVDLTVSTTTNTPLVNCELPNNLQNGLVGYWPFCGNANDESGNGNNGTVIGATLIEDRFGNPNSAYSFDGNDYIETNRLNQNSFTVNLWLNLTTANCFSALVDAYPSSWEFLTDCNSGTNLSGVIWNNSTTYQIYQSNYIVPAGSWVNLTMAYQNNLLKIYANGNLLISTPTTSSNLINGLYYFGRSKSGTDQFLTGKLDDIAIWNRLLTIEEIQQINNLEQSTFSWSTGETTATINPTPTETTEYWVDVTTNGVTCREYITINVTSPEAPTGDSEQTFCTVPNVADLSVIGENIQWYDATINGNLLDPTTTLSDGQTIYASQTVNGCGSDERLAVTVSIQDIEITASATEVCSGDEVTLSLNNETSNNETFIGEYSLSLGSGSSHNFDVTIGQVYRLEIQGNWTWGTYCPQLAFDPAYTLQGFYEASSSPLSRDMACNDGMYASIFCENPNLRPTPDVYNDQHAYSYFFTASSNQVIVGFTDEGAYGDNCGGATFRLYESSYANQVIWSTGDTTETISVNPTETTEYWVDVTTNGVTCREYITINVTSPEAPTGDSEQTFCTVPNVADLSVIGENIQWYDATINGNLLDPTTILSDGQTIYASQTVNGCVSDERLAVTVSIQDIEITASATEVCSGDEVTLSLNSETSNNETFIGEYSLSLGSGSSHNFDVTIGQVYRLEIQGNWTWGTYCPQLAFDPAYTLQGFYEASSSPLSRDMACNDGMYASIFCENPNLRPTPDVYNDQHAYSYFFTASSNQVIVGFTDEGAYGDNCGGATFRLYESSYANQVIWSTGETTETISVNPTQTTEYWVDVTTNGFTCREYITITVTPEIIPTFTQLAAICYGETLNPLPTTSTNGVTGSWSPALDNTVTTTYTFTPDEGQCAASATMTIIVNPIITPTFTQVASICTGESLTALPTTSDNSITGTWSPALNNTATTTYTFTPDIGQCAASATMTIIVNPIITPTFTQVASICTGESLTALPTTSDNSITGTWSPALNNTATTTYTFTPDIGQCAEPATMTIVVNITNAAIGSANQEFCEQAQVSDVIAFGTNIQWYDAPTGGALLESNTELTDGQTIYATQTLNGCESNTRLQVVITIHEIPFLVFGNETLFYCLEDQKTLSEIDIDSQGYVLLWYDAPNNGNILPETTLIEDGEIYYATLYDTDSGCEKRIRISISPTVIPCKVTIYNALSLNDNGINDYMVIENVEYFPENRLEIYNRDGQLLYKQNNYGVNNNYFYGIANIGGITNSGEKLPTGSYLYVFKYYNPYVSDYFTFKGFLTINSN